MQRGFRHFAALASGVLTLGISLWAQKPKSPKETQAILAVQVAKTVDERIAAIENVLTKFADTEFKVALLQMAVQAEEEKGDYAQTVFYADRLLKADPKNAFALVNLAAETARHIRENDLDRDEKLGEVEKWANEGIEAAKTMPKTRAEITDEQWEAARKDFQAQGYEALGMADWVRKNYDGAIVNYKKALTTGVSPQPATFVRLAQVYAVQGKADDAVFTLDKAINSPDAAPQVKSIAEGMKQDILKRKAAAGAKPAAPPSGEIKQP
jgi:tetratricopeptide (TPR) repeat protein